jgi:hypothetical protein
LLQLLLLVGEVEVVIITPLVLLVDQAAVVLVQLALRIHSSKAVVVMVSELRARVIMEVQVDGGLEQHLPVVEEEVPAKLVPQVRVPILATAEVLEVEVVLV